VTLFLFAQKETGAFKKIRIAYSTHSELTNADIS